MPDRGGTVGLVVNLREVERSLKAFDVELAKRTRRLMAAESRKVRDEVRADWPSRRSARAVTSGTRGLNPTLKFNRGYRPEVGWLIFGGRRRRSYPGGVRVDRRARVAPPDGYAFYPGVKRARRRVEQKVRGVLRDAVRQVGLD